MAEPSETEQYLAEVKERATAAATGNNPTDALYFARQFATMADVATLVEMVQKLRSYLLYIVAETDIAVVHVKASEGILDVGRIAREAREKSGE